MERRQFLAGCSVAVIAAASDAPRTLLDGLDRAAPIEVSKGRAAFEALVGRTFRAYDWKGRFQGQLRLVGVEHAPHCCDALDQFTVVWEQTTDPALPEDTYYLTDQSSAALTLHVAPAAAGSRRYGSAFSRLRTS